MTGVLKLYLLGVLIGAPGIADQNDTKLAKAQAGQATIVAEAPVLNNYKTCLLSAKKQFSSCTTKTNKSIQTSSKSAHSIFKKQRVCEMKKEESLSGCKKLFLR